MHIVFCNKQSLFCSFTTYIFDAFFVLSIRYVILTCQNVTFVPYYYPICEYSKPILFLLLQVNHDFTHSGNINPTTYIITDDQDLSVQNCY